jgi:hypothetical protein
VPADGNLGLGEDVYRTGYATGQDVELGLQSVARRFRVMLR